MQENSFKRKGSPFLPSGPTSYVFGFGQGQQMGEEAVALCSSTHSGGAPSRTSPISPSTHTPQPPGTRLVKSGHIERTNTLKTGALSYKVLVSSSSWHLLLTK